MSEPTISLNGGPDVPMSTFKEALEQVNRGCEGHNSGKRVGGLAVDQLKSIIARLERLEETKASIAADIRDVFAEAKGNGFDVKAIRTILKMRKLDASEREEQETILDVYLNAMGMLPDYEDDEAEQPGLPLAGGENPPDERYEEAVRIVKQDGKASASYLARVMELGFSRACVLIERMEREGVVGPAR